MSNELKPCPFCGGPARHDADEIERQEPVADNLTKTAPPRIWLQIDPDTPMSDRSDPFPDDLDGITWCADSVGGMEVEYVRDAERIVMRKGYCSDCDNNPDESVALAARTHGSPCNGCWFTDEKANWESMNGKQYYADDGTLMNADGTRSIFDDVDA